MKRRGLRIICIIFVSVIIIVASIAGTIALSKVYSSITNDNASAIVTGAGLNVVAIAIAVWAGLNIANAFDRRELLDYTSNLRETNDSIKKELEDTKSTLHERYLEEFLLALYSSLDPQHMRISRWLSNTLQQNKKLVTTDGLIKLTKFETVYNRIVLLKRQKSSPDSILTEVSSIYELVEKATADYGKKSNVSAYLHFLLAELSYYSGFAHISKAAFSEGVKKFQNAADEYQEYVYRRFRFDIRKHYTWGDNHTQQENEEMAYLLNSIGSCYSECILCFVSANDSEKEIIKQLKWNEQDFFEKAKKCCELSTVIQESTSTRREVYYRNYGCVFEREFMFQTYINGQSDFSLLEDAGKQFEKAYSVDRTSSSIYHTIISNYDKRIRLKLMLPIKVDPKGIPPFNLRPLQIDVSRPEICELLKQQAPYIEAAKRLFPVDCRFEYFYIQSCIYHSLTELDENRKEQYLDEATKAIPFLEKISTNGPENHFYRIADDAINQAKDFISRAKRDTGDETVCSDETSK